MLLAIAAATLVSEDLTCIGAGLLVSRGELPFAAAVFACFAGILAGDLALYGVGRWLGRAVLASRAVRFFASADDIRNASAWLSRRGPAVVFAARFVPGTRLPTYLAGGAFDTPFLPFAGWFAISAAVWTPLIVGIAAASGSQALGRVEAFRRSAALFVLIGALALFVTIKLVRAVGTYRGRRLLVSTWRRTTRWEFWPPWVFYAPVAAHIVRLALRHRGLTVFTAANPAIPNGGFIGESKADILDALERGGAPVARLLKVRVEEAPEARVAHARRFLEAHELAFPVVVKPDVGERGREVSIVRDEISLERLVMQAERDLLIQEFIPGVELGVFYVRRPGEDRGRIFSVTEKQLPFVVADGTRTLEELILDDPRGVAMARFQLRRLASRLGEIPPAGTELPLAEIGNHCRGALFLDGRRHLTPALEEAVERMSRRFEGFHFGRYDLKAPSLEAFREGRDIRILELNGVASEATHVYDPSLGVVAAWCTLFEQWDLVFEIGAALRARGVRPATLRELAACLIAARFSPARAIVRPPEPVAEEPLA